MFKPGDHIIYGNIGVCRVESVSTPEHPTEGEEDRLYYKLAPVYDTSTIFIPVDSSVFMRPIISKEKADALIAKIPKINVDICESHNLKILSEHYDASLKTHKCEDLIQLIKTVYTKNQDCLQTGRRPSQTDQKYMKRAQSLLHGEFAIALGIPIDDVEEYISKKIEI